MINSKFNLDKKNRIDFLKKLDVLYRDLFKFKLYKSGGDFNKKHLIKLTRKKIAVLNTIISNLK